MNDVAADGPAAGRSAAATWLFLLLLVLPFHPHLADAEQVRRGILLVLCGAVLLLARGLPRVHGERTMLVFFGFLVAAGAINFASHAWLRDANTHMAFASWDAMYRLLHWVALWVVLRFAARAPDAALLPMATALLLTAGFGLVQRLGFGEIAGYGVEREPVSVFGNLNVAAEWNAVAAVVVAVLLPAARGARLWWLAPASLVFAGSYQVITLARSGLVALPIGLCVLAVMRRRSGGVLPLCLALAGAAIGTGVQTFGPRPAPADLLAAQAELQRGTKTLQVRLEIAKSTGVLVARAPLFGHGPGQFAVMYPTVRSEQEIELSSHGRQFPTEVRTAHDDWLELLVDGGAPALVLFAIVLFVLQRAQRDKTRLLPLFVLLMMMLVRAPLGNAPAVVAALWLVGVPVAAAAQPPPSVLRRVLAGALGLLMIVFGALPIAGNLAFAPYLRARGAGEQPPLDAVRAASSWMPFEPRWLHLLGQEHVIAGNLPLAAHVTARAIALRPFDPQLYVLLGEVLAKGGKFAEASAVARDALRLDSPNPELRVLLSSALAQQQQVDAAIAAVAETPHARLRAQLATHFAALSNVAKDRGDTVGAARYAVEHHFVAAADLLGHTDDDSTAEAVTHIAAMVVAMQEAGTLRGDARPFVVQALHNLDVRQPDAALDLGERASDQKLVLPAWQRDLLGDKLAPLRSLEPWQQVLDRR